MKRRDVLKGAAAITVLPASAMAESVRPPLLQVMHPYKKQTYRELYWEAQRRIDELEEELRERRKVQVMDFDTMGRRPFYAEWDGESLHVTEYK